MSDDYHVNLLYQYRSKGLLVDTNLLLVYFIGSVDPLRIPKFKRTSTFAVEDFHTLERVFDFFSVVATTPNILTEVNSFINQLPEELKPAFYAKACDLISTLKEHCMASNEICLLNPFQRFGLTDSAIISLAEKRYLVLTDDFKLANYLQVVGTDVINFNHIRTTSWKL